MASVGLGKELECSVCLNLYTDPVTLRCGHNFCQVCIDQFLNTQDGCGHYSCPECRAEFQERPALQRNITLCNIVESFHTTHRGDAFVFCSYCVDYPLPAVKSCLLCEAYLCDKHLKVHSKATEHVLSEPSTSLQNRKCSIHKKILEYYCTEDAACICASCCLIGEHRGHKMEGLDEASEKHKKKLRIVLQKLTTKREDTEERAQSLEEHWRKAQEKANGDVKRVTALFIDIRRRLEDLEKKVLSEISKQEDEISVSLSNRIHKLEIKKDELSEKIRNIEELCNMADPLTVLQKPDVDDLCDPEEHGVDEDPKGHNGSDRDVKQISQILSRISDLIRDINVTFYVSEPADILLDVNTADDNIHISDDLKTATWTRINQNRPETLQRFQNFQVLSCSRFLSGRHYWDVKIRESEDWKVGMCYGNIEQKGPQSYLGDDKKSWCLSGELCDDQYSVIHDKKVTRLPHRISGARVRICLDYEAGQLSIYDPIRHLHTFTTTFIEPLHAALYIWKGCIKISGGVPELGDDVMNQPDHVTTVAQS